MNYPHSSHSHYAKLRLLKISLKSCRRLFLSWRHNFVTWPDLTIFFYQKLRKRRPISYGKFQHDTPNGVASSSENSCGVATTPLNWRGLTFALLVGVWTPPPLRFFADSKKTAARSAAGFSPTLSPIFLATFVKVSILGHARSGHQVRSSDHTLQKLYNRAPATVFEGKLWNFRNMIRSSVPTKFYLGFLISVTLGKAIFVTSPI